ncbi:MAG TPA: carboxypeptidase regulatory-like domain-containing protein [Gemmatimonadaceae bacterium]
MIFGRWLSGIALSALASTAAGAQVVRGVVTDSTNRPISGVVVMLLDATSQSRARALSDERGEFRVAAPGAGTYSLRTMRIGFRPTTSQPIELRAGGEVVQRIVVAGLPITLDTIRVADRNVCKAFTDSGAATFAVWEQVRAALTATELTTGFRNISATTVSYERVLDPNGSKVLQQKATVSTGYVNRPWLSLSPDSLRRIGYVVTERDNSVVYYAPGIDALLAPAFANDHCFRVTRDSRRPELVGLAFEPTPDRKKTAEISGTLWLDRASSLLRRLDFRFVNVSFEQGEMAGGDLEFVRMRNGTWAISQWDIRMPAFTSVIRPGHGAERQLAEIQVAGGQLALARQGNDTLWAQPSAVLSGTIRDSVTGAGIAGGRINLVGTELSAQTDNRGRFSLSGIIPGVYEAEIHTPSLDSLATTHRASFEFVDPNSHPDWRVPNARQLMATVCGPTPLDASRGIVVGRARVRGDTGAIRNLSIIAEYPTMRAADSGAVVRMTRVRGGADGLFRLCGVPLNAEVKLQAVADGAETADKTTVKMQGGTRLARAELTLERMATLAARGSVFTGIVVVDSTHAPIPLAEVSLPELNKSETTNSRGEFRITGIPAGEHRITVRRIGYGAADTKLAFNGTETVERRVVLGRAITLEAVQVTATAYDKMRQSFDENKRVGLGHFLERTEIAKYDGMELATVLQNIPTTGVANGRGHSWVTSRRRPPPMCPPNDYICLQSHGFYIPDSMERQQGMPIECWAQVYVDGVLQNGIREPTEPFDLKQIPPERIDKMEFYASGAETPMQYSRMGSSCGVLVVWTRQYEPKPDKPPM